MSDEGPKMLRSPVRLRSLSGAFRVVAAPVLLAIAVSGLAASPNGGSGSGNSGSGSSGSSGSSGGNSGSGGGAYGGYGSYGGNSGPGSWGSGSGSRSGGWSGSGDTLSGLETSDSGSGSNSGSGSGDSGSNSGPGSDDSDSNSGHGSANSGSGSSGRGSDSAGDGGMAAIADRSNDWRTLAAKERPDFDQNGFPARRGEVVVVNLDKDQIRLVKRHGFALIETVRLPALGLHLTRLRVPKGMSATQAMPLLQAALPGAAYELNHFYGVTAGTVETRGSGMIDMKTPVRRKLWIGMIDTAVWTNATLRDTRVEARNFAKRKSASGRPPFAHGTAVASILARQGAARLTSANIFEPDRRPYSTAEAIARALNWMVDRKVPVINISIAGPKNALVDRAIAAAVARGHVIVAAAGNDGPSAPPAYPAASPGALAVTAVDREGRVYMKANRGPHIEIAAFGVGIGAEAPDGTLKPHSGTSFAAPFVSAALARCIADAGAKQGGNCIRRMESRARDLGRPGRDPVYGHGLLIP